MTPSDAALLPCPWCGEVPTFAPYKGNGLTLQCRFGCIVKWNQRSLRGLDWLRVRMSEHWNRRTLTAALAAPSPGEGVFNAQPRYFCDGPNGHFYCADLDTARRMVNIVDPEGDDWTVTDTLNPHGADHAR